MKGGKKQRREDEEWMCEEEGEKKKGWRITKLQTERGQRKEEEEEEERNGQETGEEEKMDGNVFKELAEMRKKDRDKQSTSVLHFSCFSARLEQILVDGQHVGNCHQPIS